MLDTRENIKETVNEIREWIDTLNLESEEYQNMDLSYLDIDEQKNN